MKIRVLFIFAEERIMDVLKQRGVLIVPFKQGENHCRLCERLVREMPDSGIEVVDGIMSMWRRMFESKYAFYVFVDSHFGTLPIDTLLSRFGACEYQPERTFVWGATDPRYTGINGEAVFFKLEEEEKLVSAIKCDLAKWLETNKLS
jgi:hypothetical protein